MKVCYSVDTELMYVLTTTCVSSGFSMDSQPPSQHRYLACRRPSLSRYRQVHRWITVTVETTATCTTPRNTSRLNRYSWCLDLLFSVVSILTFCFSFSSCIAWFLRKAGLILREFWVAEDVTLVGVNEDMSLLSVFLIRGSVSFS